MKAIKATLDKSHRPELEKLRSATGLSFNQIVNIIFVRSGKVREDLLKQHNQKAA